MTSATADRAKPEVWAWYFRPHWRSILTWPLGLYYLGAACYVLAWLVAWHIDVLRWNVVIWLFFGWWPLTFAGMMAVFSCLLLLIYNGEVWLSQRLGHWWALPIKLVATLIMSFLVSVIPFFIMVSVTSVLEKSLRVDMPASKAVVEFFSMLGLWSSLS